MHLTALYANNVVLPLSYKIMIFNNFAGCVPEASLPATPFQTFRYAIYW